MLSDDHKTLPPPDWLAEAMTAEPFDVRPILAAGEDPYQALMARATTVESGGTLTVEAPFNPVPLRRVLARQGFSSWGMKLAENHWRIGFRRDGAAHWERDAEMEVMPEGAACWREEDGIHIDVRKLERPQPMLAILRLLEELPGGENRVVVHHERMPHFLIPELAERGWRIARTVEEFANLRLWLERDG